jgi:prolyl-tRNA synthetase
VLARRDKPGKEGKSFVPQPGLVDAATQALDAIQKALYERALNFRNANTADPKDYQEFKTAVEKGFAYSFWCGNGQCEKNVKEETKATLRCIPFDQPKDSGLCIYCGKPASERAYFAKAY